MKKYLIASSLLVGCISSPLFAEESKGFYLSLGGGLNAVSEVEGDVGTDGFSFDTNSPFQYSLAIGKEFEDWRLEFNYSASTVSSDSFTVTPAGQNSQTRHLARRYHRYYQARRWTAYTYRNSLCRYCAGRGAGAGRQP